MSEGPLSGIKVIEYGNFISAPYCVKLMADLGAEGIKIEHPCKPDSSRQHGPFPGDVPHHERSGLFLFLNANKLGVTLNLEKTSGKKIFKELIETSDALIENNPPGYLEGLGLGYSSLREINPRFIMASITPFGQTGPYKDYNAYGITSSAASGWSNIIGEQGREPLAPPLSIGYFLSGAAASVAVLCALFARDVIGEGQFIDISDVECWNMLFTGTQANAFIYHEKKRMRHGHRTPAAYPYAVLPCQDGYMWMAAIQGYQWKRFLEIMGDGEVPEWYRDDPRFKDRSVAGRDYADELDALLAPWLMSHSKEEIFDACRKKRVPFAPIRDVGEVVNDPHLNARDFFQELEHPEAGRLKYPGPPYRFSRTPWRLRRPAPLLGEYNEEIYCNRLGYAKEDLTQFRRAGII